MSAGAAGAAERVDPTLIAPIVLIAVVTLAGSFSFPLISLLLERAGESGVRIGFNTAMASLAILIVAPLGARVLRKIGAAPFLAICLALVCLSLLGFRLWDNFWWWCVLRFVLGGATGGLFLGSEFWIMSAAPEGKRGRVVAAYVIALSAGIALGPLLLAAVGPDGWTPFLVAAAVTAAAGAPLALAWSRAPQSVEGRAAPAFSFFLSDPSLVWGVVLFGALEFGVMALAPVWGVRLGLEETAAIGLAAALGVGGFVAQPLYGWAADRFPPRPLLFGAAFVSIIVAVLLAPASAAAWALYPLFAFWGGFTAGLYTVSLTALGARYRGAALASANAALVAAYGLGALCGPPIAGAALDLFGDDGLAAAAAGLAAPYLVLVALRARRA